MNNATGEIAASETEKHVRILFAISLATTSLFNM
jgi:hypothetical protein